MVSRDGEPSAKKIRDNSQVLLAELTAAHERKDAETAQLHSDELKKERKRHRDKLYRQNKRSTEKSAKERSNDQFRDTLNEHSKAGPATTPADFGIKLVGGTRKTNSLHTITVSCQYYV